MPSLGALTGANAAGSWVDVTAGVYTCTMTGVMYAGQTTSVDAIAAVTADATTGRYRPEVGTNKPSVVIEYRKDSSVAAADAESVGVIPDFKQAVNIRIGTGQLRAPSVGWRRINGNH